MKFTYYCYVATFYYTFMLIKRQRYPHYRPTEDVDARVHIFTATALGRGSLYPWYSFYRRLSGPQDQSGCEGVEKNLHPFDSQD